MRPRLRTLQHRRKPAGHRRHVPTIAPVAGLGLPPTGRRVSILHTIARRDLAADMRNNASMSWILTAGWLCFVIVALAGAAVVSTSLQERRWRPAVIGMMLFAPLLALCAATLLVEFPGRPWILLSVLLLVCLGTVVVLVPIGPNHRMQIPGQPQRLDERDAIFHRFYRLEPGMPAANGYEESFFSRLRDELLNAEAFMDLPDAKALAAYWQSNYNHRRPHSSLGYLTPAEFAAQSDSFLGALPPDPRLPPLRGGTPGRMSKDQTLIALGT